MDFKRIQMIFLIAFVIIDIVLFSDYRKNSNLQDESIINGNNSTAIKEMRNDQISLPKQISDDSESGYYLAANQSDALKKAMTKLTNQTLHYSSRDHTLRSTFKRNYGLYSSNSSNGTIKALDLLVKNDEIIPLGKNYQYCKNLSSANNIVYVQKAYNNIIFSDDASITFHINSDHMLTGYTQRYLDNLKPLREKAETISEEKALTALYQYNEIPNNTKVIWTHLAYTKLVSIKKNYIYIPTWLIAISNGNSAEVQVKYINAFNGSVIDNDNVKGEIN